MRGGRQFEQYPPGKWDPATKINGQVQVNTPSAQPWVFNLTQTFPNLPIWDPAKHNVLGGQPDNAGLQIQFVDHPRWITHIWLLYESNDTGVTAHIETTPSVKGQPKPSLPSTLLPNQWNVVVVPQRADRYDIKVLQPQPGAKLLLAQVLYFDVIQKELWFPTRDLRKRSEAPRALAM
jgi:hypothetical protein